MNEYEKLEYSTRVAEALNNAPNLQWAYVTKEFIEETENLIEMYEQAIKYAKHSKKKHQVNKKLIHYKKLLRSVSGYNVITREQMKKINSKRNG